MTPNSASTLLAGKYEVLEGPDTCATGGPRRVRHAVLGTEFALTVAGADAERAQDAIRRAAALRHEHIVPVVDLFDAPSGLHAVETLADDGSLAARLAQGPLAPVEALRFARQLAEALGHAHAAGVVHGALTSATVRVDGATGQALVAGLARAACEAAPDVDARADVFALGCLLFEMLEGRPLDTAGEGPIVPRYSRIAPTGVPALVGRAVRRRPADRFQSMAEVVAAIDACLQRLGEPVAAPAPAAAVTASGRPVRRVVPDPTLVEDIGEDETPADETAPMPPTTGVRMKDMLLARAARAGARPAAAAQAPRPVVVAEGGRRHGSGRVVAVAGAIAGAVVALTLVLGWPRRPAVAPAPVEVIAPAPAPAPLLAPVAVIVPEAEPTPPPAPAEARPASRPEHDVVAARGRFEAAGDPPVVTERNLAPRIASQQPAAKQAVRVTEGASVELAVRASDRNAGDQLRYAWFVDGEPQPAARGARWRFAAGTGRAGTVYTVAVQVTDRAGLRAPRATWRVEVTPRMTETNVHDWLTRLALAYERKDIAALRLFGLVTTDAEAAAIRKRVPWLGGYHVAAVNPTVHVDRQYASVAFDRVESDGRGRVIRTAREAYQLEKQPNGFVGLRAR